MSKSVLILDTPKMCDDCMFHYNTYDENDCFVDKCSALKDDYYHDMTIDGYTKKYDGCPLKELPEKEEVCGEFTYEDMWGADEKWAFQHGWNACLKKILGE